VVEPQFPQPARVRGQERRGGQVGQDGADRGGDAGRQGGPGLACRRGPGGPQVAVLDPELVRLIPGQRLGQRPVRQAERGAGGLERQADGERVAPGVGGDRLGQLAPQGGPAVRVGEPVPRPDAGRRGAADAHRRQRGAAQETVPAEQVTGRG
jgi:hypothetical protein